MRKTALFLIVTITGFFGVFSQNISLANNYLDQGEYAKAEVLFKKLYENNRGATPYFEGYVKALQEQEKYDEAEKVLFDFAKSTPNFPGINVKIGRNYELKGDEEQAETYYQKALLRIPENINFTYKIGQDFRNYNLLTHAAEAFKLGLQNDFNPNFAVQLAQIYGEQGELEKMFTTFLNLIVEQPNYYYSVNRYFTQYISSENDNEANVILRNTLLRLLQKDPEITYNRVLSWLYVQENEFRKAFVQEKAIYHRSEDKNLSKISELARIASEKDRFDEAEEMLNFVLENLHTADQKVQAHAELLAVKIKKYNSKDYPQLKKEFEKYTLDYQSQGANTFLLEMQQAEFLAFKLHQEDKSLQILENLLRQPIGKFQEAQTKMLMADVLVRQERFNKALVYYSQVKNLVNNTPLAQEAVFKVAKTSYYKGDFDWAQTQLKIVKQATSELIANDAIALHLLIEENRTYDSTQTALKLFAKADLYEIQEKYTEALALIQKILKEHPDEYIVETALIRSAKLHEKSNRYEEAEKAYTTFIEQHANSILMADALYHLAELYRTKLNQTEKAMESYKRIVFEHPDSIFFVDSRKKFRSLRGDSIL